MLCAQSDLSAFAAIAPHRAFCGGAGNALLNMKEMRDGIQLSIDGQAVSRMRNGERLTVTRSPHDAQLVRFPRERNFFSLLKDKLSQWSL